MVLGVHRFTPKVTQNYLFWVPGANLECSPEPKIKNYAKKLHITHRTIPKKPGTHDFTQGHPEGHAKKKWDIECDNLGVRDGDLTTC